MPNRSLLVIVAAVLVAGCAASRVPQTGFAEPRALERALMSYYERHATEENRTCLAPFMYGLTQVDVVEEHPDRLVLDVRYLYRDRNKDDRGDGLGRECSNYGKRRFTLGKDGTAFEVLEMTGPQRWRPPISTTGSGGAPTRCGRKMAGPRDAPRSTGCAPRPRWPAPAPVPGRPGRACASARRTKVAGAAVAAAASNAAAPAGSSMLRNRDPGGASAASALQQVNRSEPMPEKPQKTEPAARQHGSAIMARGDEAAPGTPGAGEDVCPACGGSGQLDGQECDVYLGRGRVIKAISAGP